MPLIDLPVPKRNPTTEELAENVGATNEQLAYLLNGFLGSMNIKELTADKVNAGVLNAGKVKVFAGLNGGAFIQIDGTGIMIFNGVELTFHASPDGNVKIAGEIEAKSGHIGGWAIEETKLSGEGMIEGGLIKGAHFEGGWIDVETDVYIGEKLYMNPLSFQSEIVFAPNVMIFGDPAGKSINLMGQYVNVSVTQEFNVNGVNLLNEINLLKERVSALENGTP